MPITKNDRSYYFIAPTGVSYDEVKEVCEEIKNNVDELERLHKQSENERLLTMVVQECIDRGLSYGTE